MKGILQEKRVCSSNHQFITNFAEFKSMLPMYYRGAGVGILVFDICSESSFESVKYWVKGKK